MNKITAVIDLFRKGSEVANVSAWKSGQISANALALFMLAANAAANAYGHGIALDDATALCIATGVLAVVNVVATNVSSARAGILPAKATDFPRVDGISACPHPLPDLNQSPTIIDLLRKHCSVSAQVQVTPTPSMTQVPNVEAAFITLRCQ
jgi:hypothetical protein